MIETIVFFPVRLLGRLEGLFRRWAGENWHRAGFQVATGLLGRPAQVLSGWGADGLAGGGLGRLLGLGLAVLALAWFCLGGWWALALIPILRQGHRLSLAPGLGAEPEWREKPLWFRLEGLDWVSLGVIGVTGVLLLAGREHFWLSSPDVVYPVQVAQGIERMGAVPRFDDWSFAPLGRPHLYPPLLPILLVLGSRYVFGNVFEAMQFMQAVSPVFLYMTTWYAGRWLFDARWGFLALLIAGSSVDLMLGALQAMPAVLAVNCGLFMIVFFLRGRLLLTVLFGVAGWYFHLSVIPFFLIGLGLFSVWHREYLRSYLVQLGLTLACFSPWLLRVYAHLDWIQPMKPEPMEGYLWGPGWDRLGLLFWLLAVNVVLVLLVIRGLGMMHWGEVRNRVILAQIIAFLPMLFSYGGRFFLHTTQLWAFFAAAPLARHLDGPVRARRIGLFLALALCPGLLFTGPPISPGPSLGLLNPLGFTPMVSGWTFPVITASGVLKNAPIWDHPDLAWEVAAYIGSRTTETQIIHTPAELPSDRKYFGLQVAAIAERRYSNAAWYEVRGGAEYMALLLHYQRNDPEGIYLSFENPAGVDVPETIEWRQVEGVWVGLPGHDGDE